MKPENKTRKIKSHMYPIVRKIVTFFCIALPLMAIGSNEFAENVVFLCEPNITSVDMVEPTDCSNLDGQLIIHATSGSGTYEYSIDEGGNWQTDSIFIDLSTGSYVVKVRNSDGTCEATYPEPVTLIGPGSPRFLTVDASDITDCGANDGIITISVTDGIEPYEYSIDDAQTWSSSNVFADLSAGTYMAWVRNGDETCPVEYILPIEITEPVSPQIDEVILSQIMDCNGTDGTIMVSAFGGEGILQYSIDAGGNWQNNNEFSGLVAGNYTVQVSNENGTCIVQSTANILSEPPAPSIASVTSTDPTDCGTANGTITVNAVDGIGSYEYSIDGGTTWSNSNTFTDLAQGTYDIAVMNDDGTCSVAYSETVTLTEPVEPVVSSVTVSEITDCELSNAVITINSEINSGDISYSIDGGVTWQAEPVFENIAAGSYEVAVQNTEGSCFTPYTSVVEIIAPIQPEDPSVTVTQLSECGEEDGMIELIVAAGSGDYQYSIDGGVTWQASSLFTGLSAGTYDAYVSNANGTCVTESVNSAQINELTAPEVASIVTNNPSDCATTDGSIELNLQGGTGSYQYSIDGGITWQTNSGVFVDLAPGTYEISIGNSNGTCITLNTTSVTIDALEGISITNVNATDITDCDLTDGIISISAEGGNGDYQYSINNGASWQSSTDFTDLAAGMYTILVQNTDGTCTENYSGPVEITAPTLPEIDAVQSSNPTDCSATDGTITVSASLGNPPYQYSIDEGATWQDTPTFIGLNAGEYSVQISNGNETCVVTNSTNITLVDPVPPVLDDVSSSNPTDCASYTGSISINATAGSEAISYSIDGGQTWSTTSDFTELYAGDYDILVQNASGACGTIAYSATITLADPPAPVIVDINVTDLDNCEADNGAITITASGGEGAFQYSINGGYTWQASPVFSDLNEGTYNVVISNENTTCEIPYVQPITVNAPAPPTEPNLTIGQISDCGLSDGSISFNGTPGTEYSIDGGLTWGTATSFENLPEDTYEVMARNEDITCEILVQTVNIISPPQPTIINVSTANPTDCGVEDGTIVISVVSTTNDIEDYSIDGGLTWYGGNSFMDLAAGTYEIMVRNSEGSCLVEYGETIVLEGSEYAQITDVNTSNPSGCGTQDGSITINADQEELNYSIDGGATWSSDASFSGLTAGDYTITVSASDGSCQQDYTQNIVLSEPATPEITGVAVENSTSCNENDADGFINITAIADGFTLEYSIDGGSTWSLNGNFTELNAGSYNVVIRNGTNPTCTEAYETTVMLSAPNAPEISDLLLSNPSDCDVSDGTITVVANSDASAILEYSINGQTWQTSNVFNNLSEGDYEINVRLEGGDCLTGSTASLTEPTSALIADVISTSPSDCYTEDGTITITAAAQDEAIEYSIDGGLTWSAENEYTALSAGEYNVQVRNQSGTCYNEIGETVTLSGLTGPEVLAINISQSDDCDATTGQIEILTELSDSPYQYSINGGFTWSNENVFSDVVAGTYEVAVRNEDGSCELLYNETVEITTSTLPNITNVNVSSPTDCASANGTIDITSDLTEVEYSIDAGSTWSNIGSYTGLGAGSYTIQVRVIGEDCATDYEELVVLSAPSSPQITSVDISQSTDCNTPSGSINISTDTDVQYSIDGGLNWQASGAFDNLVPGSYSIVVSNTDGTCSVDYAQTVEIQAASLPEIQSITAVSSNDCYSANGTIAIESSGANNYSIDGGLTWQEENTFTGLSAGTYSILVQSSESNCQVTNSEEIILTEPEMPSISNVSSANPLGCGSEDGSITVTAEGAASYSIDGGLTWQESNTFTNLSGGNYAVLVASTEVDCEIQFEELVILTEAGAPTITEVTSTNPTDCASGNGSITIISDAASQYSINDGLTWQTNNVFENLEAGNYAVVVETGNCTTEYSEIIILNQATAPAITEVTSTNPTDCESGNGSITITSDAVSQYSIDGGLTWQANNIFENLEAGNYTVLVEAENCTTEYSEIIILNQAITPVITQVSFSDPTLCDSEDGSITIEGEGDNLQYSIDGGTTWTDTGIFTALPAGEFQVSINSTETGCTTNYTENIILVAPTAIIFTDVSITNPTACSTEDGIISVDTDCVDCEYSIDGGSTWAEDGLFTLLAAGAYDIWVRTFVGDCYVEYTEAINLVGAEAALISEVVSTDPTNCETEDGNITISATGSGTLSYSIDGGVNWQTENTFPNLGSGDYDVVVSVEGTDCLTDYTEAINLSQPEAPLLSEVISTDVTDCTGDNGSITITAEGDNLEYSIDNGQTWQTESIFSDLSAGQYDILVRSTVNGCETESEESATISETSDMEVNVIDTTTPSCFGDSNGSVEIAVTGGTAAYDFAWSEGGDEQNLSNLTAGTYTLTVTDAADCVEIITVELTEPEPFEINLEDADSLILCLGQTAEYSLPTGNGEMYEWNGPDGFYSLDAEVLLNEEGEFSVTGINSDGCLAADVVNVTYTEEVFDAEFLLPSQGLINTPVVAVDISWPIPDEIEWIYNQDSIYHERSDLNQEIVSFPYEGNYTIQMQAWSGECSAIIDHEIEIVSNPEDLENEIFGEDHSSVLEFNVFPNPNTGVFSVRIIQDAEEDLVLYLFDNDGNLLEERALGGDTSFLEDYDIQNVQPGLYMLILQTPLEWIYFNFIKQ